MSSLRIGVVGPCASGKTTLIAGLRPLGCHLLHIAQEHSYVPNMWQRIAKPDVLIFLYVSFRLTILRRNLDWTEKEYNEQMRRLSHAKTHADLYINTDLLNPDEVLKKVITFIGQSSHTRV